MGTAVPQRTSAPPAATCERDGRPGTGSAAPGFARIVIVTPVRLLGDGLVACLRDRAIARSFSIVADLAAIPASAGLGPADLILVDVTHGFDRERVRAIARLTGAPAMLAIGLDLRDRGIVACGQAGFANYVSREVSIDELCAAIADTSAGRVSCPPEAAAELLRALRPPSPRERDILALIRDGDSNKEIARNLNLALATVKHHVSNLLPKLAVSGRSQARQLAREVPWLASPAENREPRRARPSR